MKTLSIIILTAILTACGGGEIASVIASDTDTQSTVQIVNSVTNPVDITADVTEPVEPAIQTTCNLTTYIPCVESEPVIDIILVNETCNFETYIPCRAYPPVCTAGKTLVQGICTAL